MTNKDVMAKNITFIYCKFVYSVLLSSILNLGKKIIYLS